MASKGNNPDSVGKKNPRKPAAPAKKPAAEKPAPVEKKPAISKEPGRLEGQSLEDWKAHADHRGNVIHCSGGESWFETKPAPGE